jgi:class 3 adenylate cyclase/tetratricopeptide (TPR) repeat protein
MTYIPQPIDVSHIELSPGILDLTERLAENAHEVWSRQRIAEGWTWGEKRDDATKQHPCLVLYAELPASEKQYDRNAALETLKVIIAYGYQIIPPRDDLLAVADAATRQKLEQLLVSLRAAQGEKQELNVLLEAWSKRHGDEAVWQASPLVYQHLGKRFLKLGTAPLACEVARSALALTTICADGTKQQPWAKDVELRQILGLALARTANPDEAQTVLAALREEGHADEETLGMLARTYKDQAHAPASPEPRDELLKKSQELYDEAYRLTGGYWTGINVATLARLRGQNVRAAEVAAQVRQQCLAELERIHEHNRGHEEKQDSYWVLATLGEAALAGGDLREAERYYSQAYQQAPTRFGDLNSTRRHARWLLARGGHEAGLLDRWLPLPKVVVFSGHMIDKPDRPRERFPARLADAVKAELRTWLRDERALVGFSSAACGADILFQEALHELGGEAYVVLPFESDQFVGASVNIGSEGNWQERYHAVLKAATQVVTASAQRMKAGSISYDYANLVLHGLATVRARQLETDLVGLAVWDGLPGNGLGGTASVVSRWQALELPVYQFNLTNLRETGSASVEPAQATSMSSKRPADDDDDGTRVMAMLFGDAVNFSKLTEDQVPRFVDHFLGQIATLLTGKYQRANVVRNTWGDGLYLVFDNVRDAGCAALDICEMVNRNVVAKEWLRLGLPEDLNVRLALHAGPLFRCQDPVIGQLNYTGTHVSRAARLEPKTPPGEVYASEAFAALAAVERVSDFKCEYVKQLQWAKHYGTFPTYVLRRGATK